MTIVYKYDNNLYVNLTNRCTAACTFCIKHKWKGRFRGHDLKLKIEPSAKEVIKAIKNPKKYDSIVFCGYGEPLLRLEILKEVAAWIKKRGGIVRVNTSGHANLIHKRDITPELKGLVDAISISLNASDARQYLKLQKPKFGIQSFRAVIDFAKKAMKHIDDVTLTCIELPGVDPQKCAGIAKHIGAHFRLRPYLNEYENS